MQKIKPYSLGLYPKVECSCPKSALVSVEQRLNELRQSSLSELCDVFSKWVPIERLQQKSEKANSRQRCYPLNVTFWAFLFQALTPLTACREVVRKIQSHCSQDNEEVPSSAASAYCQARQRLSLKDLEGIHRGVSEALQNQKLSDQDWKGYAVKVVDGTGISMPDTPDNQKAFPQPGGQRPGCGFPVVTLVACFCLATGALLHWVESTLKSHESRIFKKMLGFFRKGDLVLTDRGYCSYTNLALLQQKQVEAVMRLHQKRKAHYTQGKRLGRYDRLVVWQKPKQQKGWSKQQWTALPDQLTLRMMRIFVTLKGFRSQKIDLITTLKDSHRYSGEDLAQLYYRRWAAELYFRHIKTTMKMENVRCQSPEMVRKEIQMFILAYNLIRALMQEAAQQHQSELPRISFKGTVDTLRQFQGALNATRHQPRKQKKIFAEMLRIIAEEIVPDRRYRSEPRVLKRRPKPYQRLTQPRSKMKVSTSRRNKGKYRPKTFLS